MISSVEKRQIVQKGLFADVGRRSLFKEAFWGGVGVKEITFRKNIEFNIKIGAHTFYDLEDQFEQILNTLRMYHDDCIEEGINICSGAGYTVEGTIDPQWSEERYKEDLMRWFNEKKGEKNEKDN